MIYFGSILLFLSLATFSAGQTDPIVNITPGTVKGTRAVSRNGTEFFCFRGIRYARPPTGPLRFKPPVPIAKWSGTYDAIDNGPRCPQPDMTKASEDCLFINVFTRQITELENPRPVLVFIHGGAYAWGEGSTVYYGPEYLMDHDIVLVTFNYRLGTLGFLSTGDEYAPGNYGMKDQVEALRWVQRNIQFFGGDPNRVTIAGQSAGAASVGLHLFSPMSRGLFHAAITASGGAFNSWTTDKNPAERALKTAEFFDCPTNSSEDLIDCLRNITAGNITTVYDALNGWHTFTGIPFSPVVEAKHEDGERFLTKDPYQALEEGDFAQVPLLVGTTKDEFLIFALNVLQNQDWEDELSQKWNEIAPIIGEYDRNDTTSELVRSFYFGDDQSITMDSLEQLGQFISDSEMIYLTVRSAQIISEKSSAPVYLYQFTYQGENSFDFLPGTNETYGVLHTDDLIYLFYAQDKHVKYPFINVTEDDVDAPVVDRMTTLWANFAETGNPTPEPSEILNNITWTPFKNDAPSYLNINYNLTLVDGLYYEDRMSFWNDLFPIDNTGKSWTYDDID